MIPASSPSSITGSELILNNVLPEHLQPLTAKLIEMGATIEIGYDSMHILGPEEITPADIQTLPYPGFPTDMQAQIMSVLTICKGTAEVKETVFENRFMHVPELAKMGADIKVDGNSAIVNGVSHLNGADITATDLRAGAAMIIAAQMAKGVSRISGMHHVERGYDGIVEKLEKIGTKIRFE